VIPDSWGCSRRRTSPKRPQTARRNERRYFASTVSAARAATRLPRPGWYTQCR
jgi:hypothetical protein